jgi:hypothetical protein
MRSFRHQLSSSKEIYPPLQKENTAEPGFVAEKIGLSQDQAM